MGPRMEDMLLIPHPWELRATLVAQRRETYEQQSRVLCIDARASDDEAVERCIGDVGAWLDEALAAECPDCAAYLPQFYLVVRADCAVNHQGYAGFQIIPTELLSDSAVTVAWEHMQLAFARMRTPPSRPVPPPASLRDIEDSLSPGEADELRQVMERLCFGPRNPYYAS